MRDRKAVTLADTVAEQDNVDIEGTRSPAHFPSSIASVFAFDLLAKVEKLLQIAGESATDNRIQEVRLTDFSYRTGTIEARDAKSLEARFQIAARPEQRFDAVSEIRPESKKDLFSGRAAAFPVRSPAQNSSSRSGRSDCEEELPSVT